MERSLDHDTEELKKLLVIMGGEVENQLNLAIRALVERDISLSERVISGDEVIDQREMEVDHRALELIIRHRPLARDLRLFITATKIAPDLERVADHAVNIAQYSKELSSSPPLKMLITIPEMATIAVGMVRDSITAFVHGDSHLARDIISRDDQVDARNEQVFRELLTYMMEDPRSIPRALRLLMVARSLERIADQATNIAEQVVFLVEAEDIRHQRGAGPGEA
jgi:phosphate transport system protein